MEDELAKKVAELENRVAALEAKLGKLALFNVPPSPFSGAHAKVTPPPDEAA